MDAALSTPLASGRPTPGFMAVFSEQLGLIGRAHWREFAILAAVYLLLTGLAIWQIVLNRMNVDFPVQANLLVALFAMAMGFTLWGREKLFQQGHMAALPVARDRHLLIRVLAGWVWLAGIVAWGVIWIAAMGLLSGSDLGFDRYLLLTAEPPDRHVALESLRQIRWTPQTWNWLAPFTTATIFYLLASAFAIGVRSIPVWCVVSGVVVVGLAIDPTGTSEAFMRSLVGDPLGLDNLMTGGLDRASVDLILPGDKAVIAWRQEPSGANWAMASAAWLALSGGLVWLAAWRHRER